MCLFYKDVFCDSGTQNTIQELPLVHSWGPVLKDKDDREERMIRGEETKKVTKKLLLMLFLFSTNNLKKRLYFHEDALKMYLHERRYVC